MFHARPQPLSVSELAQIYGWRLMLQATRLAQRVTAKWAPIVLPVVPFLWMPAMALLIGTVVGWASVR